MAHALAPRWSRLAYVVVHLDVDGRSCFLLRAHHKWGDWGLVGGHVEPIDRDRAATAAREANEELEPLAAGIDFEIVPLLPEPLIWGPEESRSSGGSTMYEAAWFALRFLRDPAACLARLAAEDYILVDRESAVGSRTRPPSSPLLARLSRALPEGLASVPLAWAPSIERSRLSIPVCSGPLPHVAKAARAG